MNDAGPLYDYLRRWGLLLLIGAIIGGLAGLAYYQTVDHPTDFKATAVVAVYDSISPGASERPFVVVRVEAGSGDTEGAAIDLATIVVAKMSQFSGSQLVLQDILTDERGTGRPWWNASVFGSVIVLLASIGFIYVWTDVQAFRKREQANQSQKIE